MKNSFSTVTDKLTERYTVKDKKLYSAKSTDINVLLNRVKLDKKREQKQNNFYCCHFVGIVLFGVLVF